MQVKMHRFLMIYFVFHLGVTCVAAQERFLIPCKNQAIDKPTYDINCTLFLDETTTKPKLQKLISDPSVKMILLNFNMSEKARNNLLDSPMELEHSNIHFYKQFRWQLIRHDVGHNLLLLFLRFKLVNMTKINLGFRTMDIDLRTKPSGCLTNLTYTTFGYRIREMLLNYTADSIPHGSERLSVCNQVITENQGIADFKTICYTQKSKNKIVCDFLKPGDGWDYLIIFRDLIAVLTLLLCPFLIPARLYTLKHSGYRFYLPEELPVTLTITKTRPSNEADAQHYVFPIQLYETLKNTCPDIEKEYNRTLKAVYLNVDERRIIPRGCAAAEFSRVLYNKLFKCKYHSDQMQTFLGSRLFPNSSPRYQNLTWYHCCRWFMNVVLLLLLPLPWIVRLLIYYIYEQKDFTDLTNAVKLLKLEMPIRGSILKYIPPLHWIFLFTYTVYFLDLLYFGILNCGRRNLLDNIKNALLGMRDRFRLERFLFHVKYLLLPLRTFGLPGLVLIPFYWILIIPVLLLYYIYYLVPLIHLVVCLFGNIATYCSPCLLNRLYQVNTQLLPFKERLINCTITCLFLLSLISAGILITESVCYLVNACFYAFIIIILKANNILPYISLGSLVVFYFFDSISNVCTVYNNFQKKITDNIIKEIEDLHKAKSNFHNFNPVNTAYTTNDSFGGFSERRGKGLICNGLSLLLFIDSQHRPHIPERFFYNICHWHYAGCPGSLTISYVKALRKYLVILLFLSFVFIVVWTFFGIYNVSSTNQMLATLAGGFLPLLINKLINRNVQIHEIDMETIGFKKCFTKAVNEYAEDWVVEDFELQDDDTTYSCSTNSLANCVIDEHFFMNLTIRSTEGIHQETSV